MWNSCTKEDEASGPETCEWQAHTKDYETSGSRALGRNACTKDDEISGPEACEWRRARKTVKQVVLGHCVGVHA